MQVLCSTGRVYHQVIASRHLVLSSEFSLAPSGTERSIVFVVLHLVLLSTIDSHPKARVSVYIGREGLLVGEIMTSLHRCSSAISSRRIYPTARRYNRPTERENVKVVVGSSFAYRTQSTATLFANEMDAFSGSRIAAAVTLDAIIKQRPSESSNNRSSWEIAMASALAIATTAGLMYLFPAQQPTYSQRSRGGDPDSGGGGFGSGGEGQYATMAFAATFDQRQDAVKFESQPTEKLATYPSKEKGSDKPYNVSLCRLCVVVKILTRCSN